MFTGEILKLISNKLRGIICYISLIGVLFFILAAAVLFYPQTLQLIFIIVFFILSFSAFLIAVKISHIKQIFDKVLLFIPKKKTKKSRA